MKYIRENVVEHDLKKYNAKMCIEGMIEVHCAVIDVGEIIIRQKLCSMETKYETKNALEIMLIMFSADVQVLFRRVHKQKRVRH